MDQISSSNTESSSSSSYEPQKSTKPSYYHSLHSVRKPIKHFIAPLPPTPLKIYKVEPSKFKETVRELTSTPEFQHRRLKDKAPPPLVLSEVPKPSLLSTPTPPPPAMLDGGGIRSPLSSLMLSPDFCSLWSETMQASRFTSLIDGNMDCFEGLSPVGVGLGPLPKPVGYDPFGGASMSPVGFSLSPTSLSWCSSVLFSPL